MADDIQPGSDPSYQICKQIYSYHPLGKKMADSPVVMAQSQPRDVTVQKGPEERVREKFLEQWQCDGADRHIAACASQARVYGLAAVGIMVDGLDLKSPLDLKKVHAQEIGYSVLDPLNTAGSLGLEQDPRKLSYQRVAQVRVSGEELHRSRAVVLMNESPLYISYTSSAFGYYGRSCYQRSLFPLKSFIQTMVTDDMVSRKAGLIIAKMEGPGSIVNNLMTRMFAGKRNVLKEAEVDGVMSVGLNDSVESLDLTNIDGSMMTARRNIILNIASGDDMPAKILLDETFAEGFGEGTEDAKYIARYVDGVRHWMLPLYAFFDRITQRRAWTPAFYAAIQEEFPELYSAVKFDQAFYDWSNSFSATWPSLLTEPESERVQVDDVKFKAVAAMLEILLPILDPMNKAALLRWAADCFNERKLLFPSPLELDYEALEEHMEGQTDAEDEQREAALEGLANGGDEGDEGSPPGQPKSPKPPRPFADASTESVRRLVAMADARVRRAADRRSA